MGLSPALVTKLSLRKPLGLFVGEREVTVSHVAVSPLGSVELSHASEPFEFPDEVPAVIERLLMPYLGKSKTRRVRVALGLPATNVYFATRPALPADRELTPAGMLHECIRSSDINVEEMQIEVVRGRTEKSQVVSLVACRRKHLIELLNAIQACNIRPFRAEPAPFALLRMGSTYLKPPRKASTVIRIFLGQTEGIALLLQKNMPMAWRIFDLPLGAEKAAVLSTTMALRVASRHCGGSGSPHAVLIHGRLDLAHVFADETFALVVGCQAQQVEGPAFDGRSIAMGLALGCSEAEESLDLSRTLKSRPPIWEVIPFGQIISQVGVLAVLTFLLVNYQREVQDAYKLVHAECTAHSWMAKINDTSLDKEKTELETKLSAVKTFLESRVLWSAYTRDAASRLSDAMVLRTFVGSCEYGAANKGGGGPKKTLSLGLSAPIPQGLAMPREIDDYLDRLRSDKTLRVDFPRVELGGLRWSKPHAGTAQPDASFTVNCLPQADKPAVKAAPKPKAS